MIATNRIFVQRELMQTNKEGDPNGRPFSEMKDRFPRLFGFRTHLVRNNYKA